jgi:hypothetical protein
MTDTIQAARDALARWGEGVTPGPWKIQRTSNETPVTGYPTIGIVGADAVLASAMTDPALREALDGMLAVAQELAPARHRLSAAAVEFMEHAERIAAVILEIDGRMGA